MDKKKHIVWFADIEKLNLNKKQDKKWWLAQVLQKGRIEDIKKLNIEDVEKFLDELYLPRFIKKLWEDYFEWKRKGTIDGTPARDN
ncbi:MAG: hypothetical protein AB1348_06790 [Nitrospirota bacterium]